MASELTTSIGQFSDKGRKTINQDCLGSSIPEGSQLGLKGVVLAMADGISSSDVSHIASETAINSLLEDYYCTSDAWTVKNSVLKVLTATNSWLHAQSRHSQFRYDKDKGYVCTLSALVIKSNTAHIFHVGDTRIYRLNANGLEQLTNDHRLYVTEEKSYLSRALGIDSQCEFDYQALPIKVDDIFILTTDGIYEYVDPHLLVSTLQSNSDDLDKAAQRIVGQAYENGSDDNLSVQIIRIDELPKQHSSEVQSQIDELPFPPLLDARMEFDGYTILREIHASSRSHVYLARDNGNGTQLIIKTPSIDLRDDPLYLERFLTEEWIARRINSAYVLKAGLKDRKRNYLYTTFEFVDGKTLSQWIIDNPKPDIELVRTLIEQVARGLRAFHNREMLHQDLRPDNIMIDNNGTVKIIDFGSVRVAGLLEKAPDISHDNLLGTALYTAPEYFLGEAGTIQSELFSLGVITFYMLSGRFPYGANVPKARTVSAQRRLEYISVLDEEREIPAWVDDALQKSVQVIPSKRYEEISEFIYDLRHPSQAFLNKVRPPLIERNPVAFWQSISVGLLIIIIYLLTQ